MNKRDYLAQLKPEERQSIRRRASEIENKILASMILIIFVALWVIVLGCKMENQIAMMLVGGTIPLVTLIVQHYWRKSPGDKK